MIQGNHGKAEPEQQLETVTLQRNILLGVCAVLLLCVLVLVAALCRKNVAAEQSTATVQNEEVAAAATEEPQQTEEQPTEEPEATPTATEKPADPSHPEDWRMILVNQSFPVPEEYEVSTQIADSSTKKELQMEAAVQYAQMKDAAEKEGITLQLCSAYRSVDYQTKLYQAEIQEWLATGLSQKEAEKKAATVVAVPGYSEHNTGLAADIVTPDHQNLDEDFENTDAFVWLQQHAAEYGFILRYPEGKEVETGIIYEPWHYRYVGAANAKAINESGLCLEEYWREVLGASEVEPELEESAAPVHSLN